MADNNSTIKTTVVLDTTQAQAQLIKLNAVASDSTKSLEERVEAKNEAVKLQNQISKKTIDNLKDEIDLLEKQGAEEKKIEKLQTKLNKEKLKATKLSEAGAKQQAKLNSALIDSKDSVKGLDDATGGLLGKMKAFATNPIGAVISALAGLFLLFREAVQRSGKASTTFGKIAAKLQGIFNGILAVLEPVVEFIGEKLLAALEDPIGALEDLGKAIVDNVINRFKALLVLGDAIAELFKGNFKEAGKLAADGFLQLATGVEDATDKIADFAEVAKEKYNEAAVATESLVDAEKRLARNRITLEKQQLTSLRLAEEQRQIRDDTSKSIDERIAANQKLGKILENQMASELAVAQQTLDLAKAQQAATGDTLENIEAVGDAEIKLLEIQERITGQRSEQIVNETALLKEKAEQENAAAEARFAADEAELERRKVLGENVLQEELALLERRKEQELANATLTEEQKAVIRAEYRNAETEILEEERLKQEELKQRDFDAQLIIDQLDLERRRAHGENVLNEQIALLERQMAEELKVADLTATEREAIEARYTNAILNLKKQEADANISAAADAFGLAKEVTIAEMVFAAPKAVGESFKSAAAKYPPPLSIAMGALGAAGTVAPIIKGLAEIKKSRFPGKKGKGATTGGGSGGSISQSLGGGVGSVSTAAIGDIAANNASRLGIDPSLGSQSTANAANNIAGSTQSGVVFSESRYSDFQQQVQFKESKTTIG